MFLICSFILCTIAVLHKVWSKDSYNMGDFDCHLQTIIISRFFIHSQYILLDLPLTEK